MSHRPTNFAAATVSSIFLLLVLLAVVTTEARHRLHHAEREAVSWMVEQGCGDGFDLGWYLDPEYRPDWSCPEPYLEAAHTNLVAFGPTSDDFSGEWNSLIVEGGGLDAGCVVLIQTRDIPCEPSDCAVTVCYDGTVVYKEPPDIGSVTEQFWETLASYRPRCHD